MGRFRVEVMDFWIGLRVGLRLWIGLGLRL